MDFRKELGKELGLGSISENTMLDDYVKACEAIAVRYHESFQIKNDMEDTKQTEYQPHAGNAFIVDVSSIGKCPRCKANDSQLEHTCPYAEEINNDNVSLCDCCYDCEQECCMGI